MRIACQPSCRQERGSAAARGHFCTAAFGTLAVPRLCGAAPLAPGAPVIRKEDRGTEPAVLEPAVFGPSIGPFGELARALRRCAARQRQSRGFFRQKALSLERACGLARPRANADLDGAEAAARGFRSWWNALHGGWTTAQRDPVQRARCKHEHANQREYHGAGKASRCR